MITSTLISPLRARKYHAIRENSRGKWPTVSSPFTTFTACLSMGLLNSSNKLASLRLGKHDILAQLMRKANYLSLVSRLPSLNSCVVTKQTFCIVPFPFKFYRFLSTVWALAIKMSQRRGKLIKKKLLKGFFKVD